MQDLVQKAKEIEPVPFPAAQAFEEVRERLTEEVLAELGICPRLADLIGHSPGRVLREFHEQWGKLFSSAIRLNYFELLVRTNLWFYRAYRIRGFAPEFFPTAWETWQHQVEGYLQPAQAAPVMRVLEWCLDHHQEMLAQAATVLDEPQGANTTWTETRQEFLEALLQGDHRLCLGVANRVAVSRESLESFYLHVLQPALQEIGKRWERGEISVAHEHLASAIVSRVMAALYPRFLLVERNRGRVVMTAAPNELHELGGRMVADLLELDGWDVPFLGADTPIDDVIQLLRENPPFFLAVTVTMPFNLDRLQDLIARIRAQPGLQHLPIMIGGKALTENPDLWAVLGADAWGPDARSAVKQAAQWWEEGERVHGS